MTRKKNVLFTLTLVTTVLIFFSCIGVDETKDPVAGIKGSQPGSGPDTLTAIFTSHGVSGSVDLTLSSMSFLRSGHSGSSGDTLVITMARRVCQPGSSGDTCYTLIETKMK